MFSNCLAEFRNRANRISALHFGYSSGFVFRSGRNLIRSRVLPLSKGGKSAALLSKVSLIPAGTAFSIAVNICLAAAWNWPALVVFRFIGGLGIGGSSVLGPMYIAEIAPANLRGRLIGLFGMSSFGLRAFSGVTVGVMGSLIGVHWSLALSALALAAVTLGLLAFATRSAADLG